MKKRILLVLCALAMSTSAWAVGTCAVTDVTSTQIAATSNRIADAQTVIVTVSCTADSATGAYPSVTIPLTGSYPNSLLNTYNLTGYLLYQVGQTPGSTAPTANYTTTITDTKGFALDLGLLTSNGSASGSQLTAIATAATFYPVVRSALTVAITGNSVHSAVITLDLIFRTNGAAAAIGGGSGTVSGQTNGVIPLATASTTIGAQSALSDNGTTVTSTEPLAAPSVATGTPTTAAKAALPTGSHGFSCDESATQFVPAAGVDGFACDSVSHQLLFSSNNSALAPMAVASPAWTVTTPTVTCSGTPTAITSSLSVGTDSGKTRYISLTVTDTTNGTCAGYLAIQLTFTPQTNAVLTCREVNVTGSMGQGAINSGNTQVAIYKYDNSYLGGTGYQIWCSGVVQSQ